MKGSRISGPTIATLRGLSVSVLLQIASVVSRWSRKLPCGLSPFAFI
ncbi:hypothetical protein D779_2046 [Imhoffiella purpurea]|uniref:Uncharacterized protein n=1 Tax=Imhoffiella purpurea TaxID=1249627 RepID=W9VWQ8_9GAMM|nr:hypothetical protein D779_2046 [Imhoffiella purpurea]